MYRLKPAPEFEIRELIYVTRIKIPIHITQLISLSPFLPRRRDASSVDDRYARHTKKATKHTRYPKIRRIVITVSIPYRLFKNDVMTATFADATLSFFITSVRRCRSAYPRKQYPIKRRLPTARILYNTFLLFDRPKVNTKSHFAMHLYPKMMSNKNQYKNGTLVFAQKFHYRLFI